MIVATTFPKQDTNLGLEPSVLTVLPEGDNLMYAMTLQEIEEVEKTEGVELYLCSIYITGMEEFFKFASSRPKEKIICGGYEPTINPQDFTDYAVKVITGPCDSLFETIEQSGQIVKGITRNHKIPRYDLYDVRNNQQIIPDKRPDDVCTSVNTSQGCPFNCDFCCSPLMCDHIMQKPLGLLHKEIDYIKDIYAPQAKFIFIRDENFPLQVGWKERLLEIERLGAKIYLFASSNLCTEENVAFMASHGVYMVCLGLEDITVDYSKNRKLTETCERLHKYGIYVYLSFIVNPLKVNTPETSESFYKRLLDRFYELKPEMVCGNFLMPFRGTPIWEEYKHLVSRDDFRLYNSKSAFLEKDLVKRWDIEKEMFTRQLEYFESPQYKAIRQFHCGDTLDLRFKELSEVFK